jgi:NAD(P)-dependent dehydrogenase (short-subunit alcohol dehydrogenase family)
VTRGIHEGAVAIVTGAGSGLGRAAALTLAGEGATVLGVDLRPETVEALEPAAGRIVAHGADVTDAAEVRAYVTRARDELGGVDRFFNNAGVGGSHKDLVDLEDDEWDAHMAINLRSAFLGLKHVMRAMIAQGRGGSIVNTGSLLSFKAAPGRGDYTVAKHGVAGLTRTAAAEGARHGIRVNCVCPGPIDTPLMAESERLVNPDDPGWERRRFEEGTPLGRYGRPEEVGETVSWLLSDRVPYMTGSLVVLDGGILTV